MNSRDRATGSATNFLYRLPNQMRDVVHVNLLHCIVENGVFNVDDTNNKFMLNQESNTLTDELGNPTSHVDFPYLANQMLVYNDGVVPSPIYWGVGKGGGALLWCQPDVASDPIQLDWAIKQPYNAQIWNNNIGNPTELMSIASNQNGTIVVGGNNLVSQGYATNFAVCIDAGLGGEFASFDTEYATGGPSKSVNAIAYASVGSPIAEPRWVCTGDDSLATTPSQIKIDDTNNQIVINIVDLQQNKLFLATDVAVEIIVYRANTVFTYSSPISAGYYTKEEYASQLTSQMNICLTNFGPQIPSRSTVTNVVCLFDSNNILSIEAFGLESGAVYDGITFFRGTALNILGLNPDTYEAIGLENNPFGFRTGNWFLRVATLSVPNPSISYITSYVDKSLVISLPSALPTDLATTIPSGSYTGSTFASQIVSTINTKINSTPVLSGRNVNITATYDEAGNFITFQDQTAGHPFDISLLQYGSNQTNMTVAFARLLGFNDPYNPFFGVDPTDSGTLAFNLIVPYSTWTSVDGIEWTPIKDPSLANVVGHSISIINTTTGPAVIVGTDDGVVYNNAVNLTVWSSLKTGTNNLSAVANFGKVYAVETALNQANDGVVVAIGCEGGQVYHQDDFWATPTPTLLTTLGKSPNDYDPVCNAIKYTGNFSGNYPTWIFAGSSMSYVTSNTPTLTSAIVNIVPFNSGPAQNPTRYPFLEYINAIATYEEGAVLFTALGGDNTGQYSCTDITASGTLDSWTGLQAFKNNVLIQIPTGYYTNTSLASTVAELLNNQVISGNGTFYTEVQADGTFVIANTTSGNWGIRFMNGTLEFTGTAALLGFSDVSKQYEPNVLQGQDGPYTLKSDVEGGVDLVPFEYVLLQSDKFGNDLMTNSGLSAWWLVPNVANGVNANSIVYENTRNPTLEYLNNPRDIEQFDIRVLNSNGEVIELQDNKNVTLVIEFYTKKAGCR